MEFIRRVLGLGGEKPKAPASVRFDNSIRQDSRAPQTVLASLDIDAAINDHRSALGSWLHGVGAATLGHQPAFPLLMARHQYFHEQAANMIELAQQGEWDKAVQVLNGGYRHGSSQIGLLLKELKRGLAPPVF